MAKSFDNLINTRPNQVYKDWAMFLTSLSPNEFVLLAVTIGISISQDLSIVEQNSIGNFFQSIGEIMITYNGQAVTIQTLNQSHQKDSNESS